jgi:ferric-dicitrate binding protein FerR (iron transport regulator)
MTRRIQRLCADAGLDRYIWEQARRHFSNLQDQQDAHSEAWEKLCELTNPPLGAEARRFVYRKIKNRYDRNLYARLHSRAI